MAPSYRHTRSRTLPSFSQKSTVAAGPAVIGQFLDQADRLAVQRDGFLVGVLVAGAVPGDGQVRDRSCGV
jgi:hypothetical protein